MAGNALARPGASARSALGRLWIGPAVGLGVLAFLAVVGGTALQLAYADRIVSGVRVLGLDLGGQTLSAGRALLEANATQLSQELVTLKAGARDWQLSASDLGMRVDADAMVHEAYEIGRAGNPAQRVLSQWAALLFGARFGTPVLEFDSQRQVVVLSRIAAEIDQPAIDARIDVQVAQNGRVTVSTVPASAGSLLLVDETAQRMREAISRGLPTTVQLSIGILQPALSTAAVEPVRTRAERMVEAPVSLAYENKSWALSPAELAGVLAFERVAPDQLRLEVDESALDRTLTRIHPQIGQPAMNARFEWNGGNLRLIRDSREGTGIDVAALARMFEERLTVGERSLLLPIIVARPAVTSADGPRLGIRELVKESRTSFPGATAEKQHNIRLASSNLNGTVVPPGELFSFNREVGPTTLDAGYKTGWGITLSNAGARTIPSVAGGICQVATTLFHPVFHAGYALEQRHPHLYWIQSYGQPPLGMKGLDATVDEVYGVDLQFMNNTPNYLLIHSRVEGTSLIFGLYGTKPTWDVKIEGPIITNVVPSNPTPVRQLEPTMPMGRSLQVEAAQDGFDVTVVRTVTAGDEVRRLPLRSHYLPARNVVLHGPEPPPPPEPDGAQSPAQVPADGVPPVSAAPAGQSTSGSPAQATPGNPASGQPQPADPPPAPSTNR